MTTTPDLDLLTDKCGVLCDLLRDLSNANDDEPVDRVQVLRMIRDTADSALRHAVPLAMKSGDSWAAVGRALGTTRQAAWERYAADQP